MRTDRFLHPRNSTEWYFKGHVDDWDIAFGEAAGLPSS